MSLRVLHCPLNNGNHAWSLSRAERQLGLRSDLVIFQQSPYYGKYDEFINIDMVSLPNEFKRIKFLFEAINKYDVFHFNFGQTIWDHPFYGFNYLDLPILKKAGKKIVFTFQGDDARDWAFFARKFNVWLYSEREKLNLINRFYDFNRRIRIKKVDKMADYIFALNPDIMYTLPSRTRFLPYCVDIDRLNFRSKKTNHGKEKIKIIHAPTHRLVKGTENIIKTIKKLSLKYPINFELIENLPLEKALEKYRQADIAIDQLLIGWYGGFAAEMMALGVPVISYIRQEDVKKFVPFWRDIPIVNSSSETLEIMLEKLICNQSLRKKIGQKGYHYIQKHHNSLKIALQTKKIYEDLCVG